LAGARLRFEKDGFELVEVTAEPASAPAVYAEAAMQRFVRITAGDSVKEDLAPHDASYAVGSDRCYPCKLIRVTVPATGTLNVTATWTGSPNALNLWVATTRF